MEVLYFIVIGIVFGLFVEVEVGFYIFVVVGLWDFFGELVFF